MRRGCKIGRSFADSAGWCALGDKVCSVVLGAGLLAHEVILDFGLCEQGIKNWWEPKPTCKLCLHHDGIEVRFKDESAGKA